ncbi:MAG TPA: hypothetical protein VHX44_15540 [Planctomycetota bacterium]|jgi:hypothetical protein|nr:hypothetical protein [Planctomycetota bacterium]
MRLPVLIGLSLLLGGCCWWDGCSDPCADDPPYHMLHVNNQTDQTVSVRYTAAVDTGSDVPILVDERIDIRSGHTEDLRVPRDSSVEIKADYNHVIHYFHATGDSQCSCSLTIVMHPEDFVPPMPVANG